MSVHIFVNRRKLDLQTTELTGQQLLEAAGFTGQGYDLLRLQGEGDPTGGTLIMWNEVVHLKNGDHYRVIPGNRTFGG
ncbi:MAG TPA: multiubiquitin domain-containing protein [Gemmataceae bacterium]|nr:multiubiquitin domain-containing protein [Gemmataceae bacterium]